MRTRSSPWDPSNGCFFTFPPVGASQAREIATGMTCHDDDSQKNCPNRILRRYLHVFPQNHPNPVFFLTVFASFCTGFLQNAVIYTFVAMKPFQNIMFYNVFNALISPNFGKYRYLQCFLQFFSVRMLLANSNIISKYRYFQYSRRFATATARTAHIHIAAL